MPELPEVETTRRGIAPLIVGARVRKVTVREARLRQPVSPVLGARLAGATISALERRAKYLLFRTEPGTLIVHLGMSGSLRILEGANPPRVHDHVDLVFDESRVLRFRDPRRFGLMLWTDSDPYAHALLRRLGPEPLGAGFDGAYLKSCARGRRVAVKSFIMDSHVVAGVGNIYANEALYRAGIDPRRAAGRISESRYQGLAEAIQGVLHAAIERGGTTLRDFVREDGSPGYFRLDLQVYGRGAQPCRSCGGLLASRTIAQRSTYYCPRCQR